MRIVETKVYKYSELSDEAKAKARDWFRRGNESHTFWSESVIDDFQEVAKACGFDIGYWSRGTRSTPAVYWSGFCSQDDGASFDATWRASDVDVAALLADRPATYKDADGNMHPCQGNARLRPILEQFAALAVRDLSAYGSVSTRSSGHFLTTAYDTEPEENDDGETILTIVVGTDEIFRELCNDLAHWLYQSLEQEYEHQNSDENVADNIEINEYEFTADGECF